jgi:C1A family cysteine protease
MKQKRRHSRPHFGMGWVPDRPDQRDLFYATPPAVSVTLPASTDLRKECPPVYNQECLGSCTANAIPGAILFEQIKQNKKSAFMSSRFFIYYNERAMEGTVSSYSRAQERYGIKTLGYHDSKQVFIIRNSWGSSWADKGYFYMPYAFITSNNCSDFWTIKIVKI